MNSKPGIIGKLKSIIFRHYIPIAVLCCAILIILVVKNKPVDWKLVLTILGGFLSSIYLVQKQKLEESRLFKELFTEFNVRYHSLNSALNEICESPKSELSDEDRKVLNHYFNMCGEEYLFYKQGYILPEVWEAWLNGMRFFYKNKLVKQFWDEELKQNSYYGFTEKLFG
jgi:hypothetical protein